MKHKSKYRLTSKDTKIIKYSDIRCSEMCPTGDNYDYQCANVARFEIDGEHLCALHAKRSGWIY